MVIKIVNIMPLALTTVFLTFAVDFLNPCSLYNWEQQCFVLCRISYMVVDYHP